jgi:hypothetical protein
MSLTFAPRRLAALAVAAASLVTVAGCGSDEAGAGGSGDPAGIAPAASVMYAEVAVRPGDEQRERFDAVARKLTGSTDVSRQLELAVSRLTDGRVDFRRDLEPWLGDRVGLAVTGVRAGGPGAAGDDADGALIAQTTDADAALASVGRLAATKGPARDASYKDTRYRTGGEAAWGIVDERLVIGTEAGFRAVVDAAAGESLAEGDDFERAREAVESERLAFAYVDVRRTTELMAAGGGAAGVDPSALRELLGGQGTRAFGAALHLRDDAILVDSATLGGRAPGGDPAGTVAGLPAGSWLALGLGDVGQSLQGMLDAARRLAQSGGQGARVDQGLRALEGRLGLDLEDDLLSWMGDAGLFARGTSITDIGGALVVRTKDPAKTRAALQRIRELAGGLGTTSELRGPGIDAGVSSALEARRSSSSPRSRATASSSRSTGPRSTRPSGPAAPWPTTRPSRRAPSCSGTTCGRPCSWTCAPSSPGRTWRWAAIRASSGPSRPWTR